jgi:hypothetical protein
MQISKSIENLFSSIDEKNAEEFIKHLDENCFFRFGNLPAIDGAEEVGNFVAGFFDSINSLKHELSNLWNIPGGIVCHGTVTYTRHDMSVLTVPFSNIFQIKDDKISEYLIFADTSQLYSPPLLP